MAMKKKTPKNPDRKPRRELEVPESARRLRELYEQGMREIEERRKLDPNYR
jgi:hypothetical protein